MVIDSLNLKLRQIVTFSSNVILYEMSPSFFIFSRKITLSCTYGNFSFIIADEQVPDGAVQ